MIFVGFSPNSKITTCTAFTNADKRTYIQRQAAWHHHHHPTKNNILSLYYFIPTSSSILNLTIINIDVWLPKICIKTPHTILGFCDTVCMLTLTTVTIYNSVRDRERGGGSGWRCQC